VPAKLLDGVYAPWKKSLPATALVLHLIVTDLAFLIIVLINSVDTLLLQDLIGLDVDDVTCNIIVFGVLFQNPARLLHFSGARQGSGCLILIDAVCLCYAA